MRARFVNAATLAAVLLAAFIAAYCFHTARQSEKTTTTIDPRTHLERARDFLAKDETDAAISSLDAALAAEPANQEARQLRGNLHLKKNDLDKAMADFAELRTAKDALWSPPPITPRPAGSADAAASEIMREARAHQDAGRLDEALARYTTVISMDVSSPMASVACQNRGNIYHQRGEGEKAMRDYEQAIRLNPANGGAYVNRALVYAQQGDHEAAIKDNDEALRFDRTLHQAFHNRALAHRDLGDLEAAERDLNEAIRLYPQFAAGHANLAAIHLRQGKLSKAASGFKAAREIDPALAEPLLGLAHVSLRMEKYAEAGAHLEKALALGLSSPAEALNSLAWLRATAPVRAVRHAGKAIEGALEACELTQWASFSFVDTLAAAYAENGEFAKAVEFQRYAMGLPSMRDEHRADAEKRLKGYENRRPYRESAKALTERESDPSD